MNVAAGPELAAAVSNAGGLGVIGGLGYTSVHLAAHGYRLFVMSLMQSRPKLLRNQIREIKSSLKSPDLRKFALGSVSTHMRANELT